MNKKGDNIVIEEIIFIILNLVFFVVMLIFIVVNSNGRVIYEQLYAKQIAFLIDEGKPTMSIWQDLGDISKRFNKPVSDMVKIDEKNNKVLVSLGLTGGHSFQYFTDAKITLSTAESKFLIIKIEDKNV